MLKDFRKQAVATLQWYLCENQVIKGTTAIEKSNTCHRKGSLQISGYVWVFVRGHFMCYVITIFIQI